MTRDPSRESRWRTFAWLVGPVVAVLAAAYLVFQPRIGLFADTTSASPSSLPTATPFPSPDWKPVGAASLTIRAIPFDPDGVIGDFALAGTRLVAAGSKGDMPAVWYSDNAGETWTQAELEAADPPRDGAKIELHWVAAHGSTLAAVGEWYSGGSGPFAAGIWTSVDSGAHWSPVPADDVPRKITGLESGALGFVTTPGGSTLLTSTDARGWDDVPSDQSMRSVSADGFAASGDRALLTAGRSVSNRPGSVTIPLFWLYTEGGGWSTVDRGDSGPGYIRSIFGDDDGFIAGGAMYPELGDFEHFVPTVWQSADGTRWEALQLSKVRGREVETIARGGLGILAVGGEPGSSRRAAWLVPNAASERPQEYAMKRDVRTVIGIDDRFVGFAGSGVQSADPDRPTILIFDASDEAYVAPRSD